jgi:hypothetical protein
LSLTKGWSGRLLERTRAHTFPSTVYSSMFGVPIPYTWKVQGDEVTIRTELGGGATYTGRWAEDDKSMTGGWRPDEGADPTNIAYDIWGEAAQKITLIPPPPARVRRPRGVRAGTPSASSSGAAR